MRFRCWAEPQDSVYERLLEEHHPLGSRVDDDIANRGQILLLAAGDPKKDISLYINSPGGSISAGMAIYDTMVLTRATWRHAMGMAASMGEFLLAAGAKGSATLCRTPAS